jgi:hypothetical protein
MYVCSWLQAKGLKVCGAVDKILALIRSWNQTRTTYHWFEEGSTGGIIFKKSSPCYTRASWRNQGFLTTVPFVTAYKCRADERADAENTRFPQDACARGKYWDPIRKWDACSKDVARTHDICPAIWYLTAVCSSADHHRMLILVRPLSQQNWMLLK